MSLRPCGTEYTFSVYVRTALKMMIMVELKIILRDDSKISKNVT